LQGSFAVLDFEGELDRIEVGSYAGFTTKSPLKGSCHATGKAVADLFCYDLSGSRFAALSWTPLVAPRTAKAPLIDQLQGSDLRVTAVRPFGRARRCA
jgi:hypothetical protein